MNISLTLSNHTWRPVFAIPKDTILQKGRHGLYGDITKAAGAINERFGCYSWGSASKIYYCGSFAKDYARGGFKTNLQGRVHNYLQNHRRKASGRINTNLMVFEKINNALRLNDVYLSLLTFEWLQLGDDRVDYATFSTDPNLIHAVEELLICTYRRLGQCQWNRT
jgi:hypothetical protein